MKIQIPLFRLALLATAACLCTQAEAATITVTSSADAGAGTLRAAIAAANAGDTIDFAPGLDGATIVLNSGELVIDQNVTITGLGATHLGIEGFNQRVFHIESAEEGPNVTIQGLRLKGKVVGAAGANGTAQARDGQPGGLAQGGAILQDAGLLTVNYCHFEGCEVIGGAGGNAFDPGYTWLPGHGGKGGDAQGGAIYNHGGDLVLNNCTFGHQNSATGGAGGRGFGGTTDGYGGQGGWARGGALYTAYDAVDLAAVNCTFAANAAIGGAGGRGGNAASPELDGSDGGAGGFAEGGAVWIEKSSMGVTGFKHTTISTNVCRAGKGGAGGAGATPGNAGADGFVNGWGLYFLGFGGVPLAMDNTLIAANRALPALGSASAYFNSADVWGVIASGGFNLIGNPFGSSGWILAGVPRDLLGTAALPLDPRLGPLQNNGGETPTQAPLACSPAIDEGSDCVGCLAVDQIAQPRPVLVTAGVSSGKGSDIGAYELQSYPSAAAVPLTIARLTTGNGVMIAWPASSCFILQQSATLDPPDWENNLNPVTVVGAEKRVFITPALGSMFYRLHP